MNQTQQQPKFFEITFYEGPLGLRIYSKTDTSEVIVKNFVPIKGETPMKPAVEVCGKIQPGFVVRLVNETIVDGLPYSAVLNLLKSASRPVRVTFCNPEATSVALATDAEIQESDSKRTGTIAGGLPAGRSKTLDCSEQRAPRIVSQRRGSWRNMTVKCDLRTVKPVPMSKDEYDEFLKATARLKKKIEAKKNSREGLIAKHLSSPFQSRKGLVGHGKPHPSPKIPPRRKFSSDANGEPLLNRLQAFERAIQGKPIDAVVLRRVAFFGIPEGLGWRSLTWKLFLGYIPWGLDDSGRAAELKRRRKTYKDLSKEFMTERVGAEAAAGFTVAKESRIASAMESSKSNSGGTNVNVNRKTSTNIRNEKALLQSLLRRDSSSSVGGNAEGKNSSRLFRNSMVKKTSVFEDDDEDNCGDEKEVSLWNKEEEGEEEEEKEVEKETDVENGAFSVTMSPQSPTTLARSVVSSSDDPLSNNAVSTSLSLGKQKEIDLEVMGEVTKDVLRTLPGMSFFNLPRRRAAIERILYMYAKMNPGISYVQGMNEILAPIYYVFVSDASKIVKKKKVHVDKEKELLVAELEAEADAFFCFAVVMAEIGDFFTKQLDDQKTGIHGCLRNFDALLRQTHPRLWTHLSSLEIKPEFYAFRWFTTLCSRELQLPEVIRLWDTLFSEPRPKRFGKKSFLYFFCIAMVSCRSEKLLEADFANCLKELQQTDQNSVIEFDVLFKRAEEIREKLERGFSFEGGQQFVKMKVAAERAVGNISKFVGGWSARAKEEFYKGARNWSGKVEEIVNEGMVKSGLVARRVKDGFEVNLPENFNAGGRTNGLIPVDVSTGSSAIVTILVPARMKAGECYAFKL
eukprot:g1918.t1